MDATHRSRGRRQREAEGARDAWEWLEGHPGVLGELVAFSMVALLALGLSVGALDRQGVTWGLRLLSRSQGRPGAPQRPQEPSEPAPGRTPLHQLRPEQLGRFWEA